MGLDLDVLGELERKVLWLATWTIHAANHLREKPDGLKVAGTRPPRRRSRPS